MPFRRAWTAPVALLLLLLGAGCTSHFTYTINGDGTARIDIDVSLPDDNYRQRQNIESAVARSKRVEGWSGVRYERSDTGSVRVRATAFVKDINGFRIPGSGRFALELRNNANGTRTLFVKHNRQHSYTPRKALSEAKVQEMIAKVRSDYAKQLQDPDNAKHRKIRYTLVIDPPGKVRTAINLKVRDDGRLEIDYSVADIQDALGEILKDKRVVREFVVAGESIIKMGNVLTALLNERLFGIRAQVQAVLEGPFENQFDYPQALAGAETDHGKIVGTCGFLPHPLPEAGAPGNLRDIRIVRAKRGSARGNTWINFLATAIPPKRGRYPDGLELYSVIDGKGRTLVPAHGAGRFFTSVIPDDPDGRVELRFNLGKLPDDIQSLKRVTGVLRYRALGPLFEEHLGRLTPRSGAQLRKHNFKITQFGHDARKGVIVLNWTADGPRNLAKVVLREGRKEFLSYDIEPEPHAKFTGRPFTIFDPKVKPPRTLDVYFYTTTNVELVEAPFVIEDVKLTE